MSKKIDDLRAWMGRNGLAAYLVPSTDPHQNEYVPACWRRRDWFTGFTGSAGDLVVTRKEAGLWTDGRYFLQAARELKGSGIKLQKLGEPGVPSIQAYLASTLEEGDALGVDPRVLSFETANRLRKELEAVGARLKPIDENAVDLLWTDRPPPSDAPIRVHTETYAGESVASKLRRLRKILKERKAGAYVVSSLDAIAWLFNIRGRDVEYNPLVIAYAVVTEKEAMLFVDLTKVTEGVGRKLGSSVSIRPYDALASVLDELSAARERVWIDGATTSLWITEHLKGCTLIDERGPLVAMKAKKNAAEIAGMRDAHVQDGIAMVRFLRWLEDAVPRGGLTEISAADRLGEFRAQGKNFQGLSFRTISGYAEHGAIIHYSVTKKTDVPLKAEGIYLVDSGGQYLGGTTDITRTVLLGPKATKEQKDRFTRVLQGHIGLARLEFPAGTRGMQIDVLARLPLWKAGYNYNHGTGHGVGAYLNVHEGPQSITPFRDTGAALEPGNILSNEPGYYVEGEYGIRTENLILVVEAWNGSKNGPPFLGFETITLCPIDTRLIEKRLMNDVEIRWLNDYHKRVLRELGPHLDKDDRAWLKKACAPI